MTYIGFDVETANCKAGSICQVGLARVINGELDATRSWLIRPHEGMDWVQRCCYEVHGIGWDQLENQPEFDDLWPEISSFMESGDLVVIHNASFDIRQLRSVLGLYALAPLSFDYICSLWASRRCLKGLPNYRLDTVADYFGYSFHHHDACEDAVTCAKIIGRMRWEREWIKHFSL